MRKCVVWVCCWCWCMVVDEGLSGGWFLGFGLVCCV